MSHARQRTLKLGGVSPGVGEDEFFAFREKAPGMPYAHPTVEHFAPLFVTLGAVAQPDEGAKTAIEGFWWGLSKRAFEIS